MRTSRSTWERNTLPPSNAESFPKYCKHKRGQGINGIETYSGVQAIEKRDNLIPARLTVDPRQRHFDVMAGLVPAIGSRTVPRPIPGVSPGMTMGATVIA